MILTRLHPKDPACWALIPALSERVLAMAVAAGQTDADLLVQRVQMGFAAGDDRMACWVGLNGATIVAHCLAFEDVYGGRKVGFVTQVQMDSYQVPLGQRRTVLEELVNWAKSRECVALMALMLRTDREKAWQRISGFEPYRLLMRRRL